MDTACSLQIDEYGDMHAGGDIDQSFDLFFCQSTGHVRLDVDNTNVVVKLDVEKVSEKAMATVYAWLSNRPDNLAVNLKFHYLNWSSENFPNQRSAIARIQALRQGV